MELAAFLANEASIQQIITKQQKSVKEITLNRLTYEIVPLANDENNMESNLDLLFKPVNGTNDGAKEYYTSIDLLKRMYPIDWESQRTKTALSEKTEIFGPNTQKRILRWAQFKKAYDGRPTHKEIKGRYTWGAEQLSKLVTIFPGALQDLTRQIGPINWAVNNSSYINYNGLWLLVNYGRITTADMFVKYSNPCVHEIINAGNHLEGRILQGDNFTIQRHFDAAIMAAQFEWMNIQLSQDPWILRLFHPKFRSGLKPDYRRIYAMLMSKAMTAFYSLNGERLNLPQHIHMEISRVISQYCSDISKYIGFKKNEKNIGYKAVPEPILRDELLYIEKWPAPPLNLKKGERGRMNEDAYEAVQRSIREQQIKWFINLQKTEMPVGIETDDPNFGQLNSIPINPFSNDKEEFELRHFDLSDVSGINWAEPGGYEWTEPTPEGEFIRIDLEDIDFNVKSKRGAKGIEVMAKNRKRNSLFEIIRFTIENKGVNIEEGKVYATKELKDWGWTKNNIQTGLDNGILNRVSYGQYVFQNIDWDEYNQWKAEQEEKKRTTIYRTVDKNEEIGTNLTFGSKSQKQRIKVDNLLQEKGKSIAERERVWAASVEQEKEKKEEKKKIKEETITVNKGGIKVKKIKDDDTIELEKKEAENNLTEEEKKRLRLKQLAYERKQKKLAQEKLTDRSKGGK